MWCEAMLGLVRPTDTSDTRTLSTQRGGLIFMYTTHGDGPEAGARLIPATSARQESSSVRKKGKLIQRL